MEWCPHMARVCIYAEARSKKAPPTHLSWTSGRPWEDHQRRLEANHLCRRLLLSFGTPEAQQELTRRQEGRCRDLDGPS